MDNQPPEERNVIPLDLYISLEVAQVRTAASVSQLNLPEGPVRFVESFDSEAEDGYSGAGEARRQL